MTKFVQRNPLSIDKKLQALDKVDTIMKSGLKLIKGYGIRCTILSFKVIKENVEIKDEMIYYFSLSNQRLRTPLLRVFHS